MLREIDDYFLKQEESIQACLLALRAMILDFDEGITEAWRYKMPFYFYKGKRICYLRKDKKTQLPYIGVVDGNLIDLPELEQGNRSKMKVFMIDPSQDLPLTSIHILLQKMMAIYE